MQSHKRYYRAIYKPSYDHIIVSFVLIFTWNATESWLSPVAIVIAAIAGPAGRDGDN